MSDSLAAVRTGYDRWAEVYDRDLNPLLALEQPVIHAALGDVRGKRALDLGCGTGRHAVWLAGAGAQVTALDFSAGMLDEARRKPGAERIDFRVHDLHNPLPFDDSSFDVAVSGLVLEHLRDLAPFFTEVRRVLRPRSRAAISAMHPAMFLRGSQARFTDPKSGTIVQVGSVAHSLGAMVMAALRADFHLVDVVECAPDAELAAQCPRAEKYIGYPMLATLILTTP